MKKLIVLGALVAFGYFNTNAQTASSTVPSSNATVVHEMSNDKPAKADRKKKKNKGKECSTDKAKSCGTESSASGEKKACCSHKKAEATAPAEVAPAK
ncbi:MAG: hypothetical protein MH472_06930 [Bacteroidia bacterium]|nr:hypothetical protein [Bacteroidia bacterium]